MLETGSSSMAFHSGLRVLFTVCVTTRASPRETTRYWMRVLVGEGEMPRGTRRVGSYRI